MLSIRLYFKDYVLISPSLLVSWSVKLWNETLFCDNCFQIDVPTLQMEVDLKVGKSKIWMGKSKVSKIFVQILSLVDRYANKERCLELWLIESVLYTIFCLHHIY